LPGVVTYEQWLINDTEIDLSFTAPGQTVDIVTGAEVDPVLWALWDTYPVFPGGTMIDHDWQPGWMFYEMYQAAHPSGNNLPHFQVRWDSEGTWHTLDSYDDFASNNFGGESGPVSPRPGVLAPRPNDPSTISFRGINNSDPFGLFTPRIVTGVWIRLYSQVPDDLGTVFSQATFELPFNVTALSVRGGVVSGARSYVQFVS
jgi:hypothetical protein